MSSPLQTLVKTLVCPPAGMEHVFGSSGGPLSKGQGLNLEELKALQGLARDAGHDAVLVDLVHAADLPASLADTAEPAFVLVRCQEAPPHTPLTRPLEHLIMASAFMAGAMVSRSPRSPHAVAGWQPPH